MRRALVCLPLGLVVAFAALTMWETLARSTIPLSIDGQVTEVAVRAEDGDQRVWFIEVDDEFVRMDEEIGARLVAGDVVRKDAWSTTLVVNGNDVPLKLSRDARGALWFAPLLVILGAALTWLQLRGSPDTQSRT
ncbi:MAG TPA: hypothetical protein VLI04_05400 [Nocardioidaceae bacterium]|nr:hypothetical protein [Nocardioidaceae bacterium]